MEEIDVFNAMLVDGSSVGVTLLVDGFAVGDGD